VARAPFVPLGSCISNLTYTKKIAETFYTQVLGKCDLFADEHNMSDGFQNLFQLLAVLSKR